MLAALGVGSSLWALALRSGRWLFALGVYVPVRFAKYLQKYVSPGVMRAVVRDRGTPAATWFVADARKDRIRLQFRSREGQLLPLGGGPARTMPDTLELESLVSA
jgi:hypothetical protein